MIRQLRFFWAVLRIYKFSALLLFVLMSFAAFLEVLGLGIVMPILELIVTPADVSQGTVRFLEPILKHFPPYYHLMVAGMLLVVLVLVKSCIHVIKTGFGTYFVLRFRRLWQCAIMEKYLFAEYSQLLERSHGKILNDIIIEPGRAAKSLQRVIELSSKTILALCLFILLLFANWQVSVMIVGILMGLMLVFRKSTYKYSIGVGRQKIGISEDLIGIGAENIVAIRQVKVFSSEMTILGSFKKQIDSLVRILVRFSIFRSIPKPASESLVVVGIIGVLFYLNYIAEISLVGLIPVIGLFVLTSQRFFPLISALFAERMNLLTFIPSLELVHNIYTANIQSEELDKGDEIHDLTEDIVFQDVHFQYKGSSPLFKGVTFRIPRGKMTALVGPSGAGKSTVVDLLVRLYRQNGGEILVNGRPLGEVSLRSWRKIIGYVSQDSVLFNASVRDNILMGKPDASEMDIAMAAKKAHADEFIRGLPAGYNTILGERGLKLSGGERQRIAIARAIIRNPALLIFDEATSSLDAVAEARILESIEELRKQRTTIVISHRISTVRNADIIHVLEKGRIVDSGSFDELGKKEGRFADLRQASMGR